MVELDVPAGKTVYTTGRSMCLATLDDVLDDASRASSWDATGYAPGYSVCFTWSWDKKKQETSGDTDTQSASSTASSNFFSCVDFIY